MTTPQAVKSHCLAFTKGGQGPPCTRPVLNPGGNYCKQHMGMAATGNIPTAPVGAVAPIHAGAAPTIIPPPQNITTAGIEVAKLTTTRGGYGISTLRIFAQQAGLDNNRDKASLISALKRHYGIIEPEGPKVPLVPQVARIIQGEITPENLTEARRSRVAQLAQLSPDKLTSFVVMSLPTFNQAQLAHLAEAAEHIGRKIPEAIEVPAVPAVPVATEVPPVVLGTGVPHTGA